MRLYLEEANSYTDNSYTIDNLVGGYKLFISYAIQYGVHDVGIGGQKIGDFQYNVRVVDIPKSIYKHLESYRRLLFF